MIETKRLNMRIASQSEMEQFISVQTDDVMKAAYSEMLAGCLSHPEQWDWYAIWMIELKDNTYIGDLCFKGVNADGSVEIGYGISDKFAGQGYASEAVSAAVDWAFRHGANCVTAETEPENFASQRVLAKSGFLPSGEIGMEGPRFIRRK